MIESIDNALQIASLLICASIAVYRAAKYKSRTWTQAFYFYGSWALGGIYWLLCLLFYNDTPQISIVSDLSWYAALIFLYMILRRVAPPEDAGKVGFWPWLGPIFTVGMAFFFMFHGEIISNLIYAGLMGLLLFSAIRRLTDGDLYKNQRFFSITVLILCLLEYGLWVSSCFWSGDTLANPYYWIDFLLSAGFFVLIPAIKKAVGK